MKTTKIISLITIFTLLLLFICSQANAQGYWVYNPVTQQVEAPPKHHKGIITASAGRALSGTTVNAMYDHELWDEVSLGLAVTLKHSARLTESLNLVPSDEYDKLNIGLRLLRHLPCDEQLDLYGGLRGGVSLNFNSRAEEEILPSFQAIGGLRYTFVSGAGLNIEAGLGQPYFIAAGFSYTLQ